VTTEHERRGALEAVERIVNRGEADGLAATLEVLRRLYPDVELEGGVFRASAVTSEDRELLDRVAVLVSHM
jgi:hypothetical protein